MRVLVKPHDPDWSVKYRTESCQVGNALGDNAVALHHIGSTAIPGIYAKPIVDMLVEVADLEEVDARQPAMEVLGYEAMGEFGIPGRRYLRKDDREGVRIFQIHAFRAGSAQVERHLAFRDFMRAHPEWAGRYSDLKRRLAEAHPDDVDAYMDGKEAFIEEADIRAAEWRAGTRTER